MVAKNLIMASIRASKYFEVAAAANKVMRLDTADQGALLEVIADYFTDPSYCDYESSYSGESEIDSDTETTEECK